MDIPWRISNCRKVWTRVGVAGGRVSGRVAAVAAWKFSRPMNFLEKLNGKYYVVDIIAPCGSGENPEGRTVGD